ncbi:98_t:CDS:2 [Ambispora gerdemannii]|uniref:98_t:CDS:1 n=1 Tax=Ambispora gerdemannii TaxID=144530 RepID=A0A9N8YWY5_9GLOM|nr:98_t:CDS:2 [Ambispora gerdemannii]
MDFLESNNRSSLYKEKIPEPCARKQVFECVLIVQKSWVHSLKSRWQERQVRRRSLGLSELAIGGFKVLTDSRDCSEESIDWVDCEEIEEKSNDTLQSPQKSKITNKFIEKCTSFPTFTRETINVEDGNDGDTEQEKQEEENEDDDPPASCLPFTTSGYSLVNNNTNENSAIVGLKMSTLSPTSGIPVLKSIPAKANSSKSEFNDINDNPEYDTEFWETEEEIEEMSSKDVINLKDWHTKDENIQFLPVDDDCWITEEEMEVVELSSACLHSFTTNKINYA